MKKALCVIALLAMVASAGATVRVFVTPATAGMGLVNQANAFQPTFSTVDADDNMDNAYDYYGGHFAVGTFPTLDTPAGDVAAPIEVPQDDFAYIWVRFEGEAKGAKINGLKVQISEVGSTEPAAVEVAYYLQNDMWNPTQPKRRWNGTATPPGYTEWHNNPQVFVGMTSNGLVNIAAGTDAQMMGTWLAGTSTQPRSSVHLLGAVRGTPGKTYEIYIPGDEFCNFSTGNELGLGSGVFKCLPEPASLMLLGLAGLVLRRR